MRTKSSNVILLTALFLACGVSQLSASGSNSDDDKTLAGTNPRETPATTAGKPKAADAPEPDWLIEAREKYNRRHRLRTLLAEERKANGNVRPRDSKH